MANPNPVDKLLSLKMLPLNQEVFVEIVCQIEELLQSPISLADGIEQQLKRVHTILY
jgi:hypothetical protein